MYSPGAALLFKHATFFITAFWGELELILFHILPLPVKQERVSKHRTVLAVVNQAS